MSKGLVGCPMLRDRGLVVPSRGLSDTSRSRQCDSSRASSGSSVSSALAAPPRYGIAARVRLKQYVLLLRVCIACSCVGKEKEILKRMTPQPIRSTFVALDFLIYFIQPEGSLTVGHSRTLGCQNPSFTAEAGPAACSSRTRTVVCLGDRRLGSPCAPAPPPPGELPPPPGGPCRTEALPGC